MKYVAMYGGSGLIGALLQAVGCGWIMKGHFNPSGAFVNVLAVLVWVAFIHVITDK
jgi:hypothetical protein